MKGFRCIESSTQIRNNGGGGSVREGRGEKVFIDCVCGQGVSVHFFTRAVEVRSQYIKNCFHSPRRIA